jgi:methyl-accepting chemotaxis protein
VKLHTRLLVAYGYLVGLVVIGAAGAALGFRGLGNDIGTVLEENFESVRASMEMLEALERQDSAVLTALLSPEASRDPVRVSEESFRRALERARQNVTLATESTVLDSIQARYGAYREARESLLAAAPDRPLRRYDAETYPLFEDVKAEVRQLLDLNHEAMLDADRVAQRSATRHAAAYAALVALALLSMGLISQGLQVHVFQRLDELHDVATAVSQGDLSRRAAANRDDELGLVANQVNQLLDRQQELGGMLQGRVARTGQLVAGLLGELPHPAAVLNLAGELVASTLQESRGEAVVRAMAARPELLQPDAEKLEAERELSVDGAAYRVTLVTVPGRRPVGWLVSPAAPEAGG